MYFLTVRAGCSSFWVLIPRFRYAPRNSHCAILLFPDRELARRRHGIASLHRESDINMWKRNGPEVFRSGRSNGKTKKRSCMQCARKRTDMNLHKAICRKQQSHFGLCVRA